MILCKTSSRVTFARSQEIQNQFDRRGQGIVLVLGFPLETANIAKTCKNNVYVCIYIYIYAPGPATPPHGMGPIYWPHLRSSPSAPCGVVGVWYGMLGMYGVYGRSGMACLESMVCLVCMVWYVWHEWLVLYGW